MFQVCHFHYWLAKRIKDAAQQLGATYRAASFPRSKAGFHFCSLWLSSRKWETANKNFAMRKVVFFFQNCVFPQEKSCQWKISSSRQLKTFIWTQEAFFTSVFLWILSSCQYWAWQGERLISCCTAQPGWLGWILYAKATPKSEPSSDNFLTDVTHPYRKSKHFKVIPRPIGKNLQPTHQKKLFAIYQDKSHDHSSTLKVRYLLRVDN